MKEIISLFIGQAGVQVGNSIWELLSAEHGINEHGIMEEPTLDIECLDTFFSFTAGGKYVPRALFVDLEPTVVDEIRNGSFKHLFHPDRMITGPEDAASNFARGFFTVGKLLLGTINNETRRLLESSDGIQGIFIFRSLGGGTGAGLTSAIFDGLAEYPKITKIEVPIYPSPTLATAMVEPYNCLLGEHFCMEDIDVGLLLDNEALYDICSRYLSIEYPTFSTINRLIAQLCSSITASVRFENVLNCDITVLQTNLVPYPRIHFPLANFAPVLSPEKAAHEELSVMELTRYVFERENQMMKVDHSFGRFMSCSLLYRGTISPYHVYQALTEIKRDKNIEFVDWCPTGFKVGINVCPPTTIPASQLAQSSKNVTMLTNTSAIGQAWQRLTHKFYLLYSKRSFVHWFVGEGMEECEFTESLYNISALVKDYEEAAMDSKFEGEEENLNTSPPSAPATNGSLNQDNAGAEEINVTKINENEVKEDDGEDTGEENEVENEGGAGGENEEDVTDGGNIPEAETTVEEEKIEEESNVEVRDEEESNVEVKDDEEVNVEEETKAEESTSDANEEKENSNNEESPGTAPEEEEEEEKEDEENEENDGTNEINDNEEETNDNVVGNGTLVTENITERVENEFQEEEQNNDNLLSENGNYYEEQMNSEMYEDMRNRNNQLQNNPGVIDTSSWPQCEIIFKTEQHSSRSLI